MRPLVLAVLMAMCLVYTAQAQTLDSLRASTAAVSAEVEALYADYQALQDSLATINAEHQEVIAAKDARIVTEAARADSAYAAIREVIEAQDALRTLIE